MKCNKKLVHIIMHPKYCLPVKKCTNKAVGSDKPQLHLITFLYFHYILHQI